MLGSRKKADNKKGAADEVSSDFPSFPLSVPTALEPRGSASTQVRQGLLSSMGLRSRRRKDYMRQEGRRHSAERAQ